MSSFQHAHHHDSDGKDLSLDELNTIMNLQRQEAFDETLEEVHASLSKRDSVRKSLTALNSSPPTTNHDSDSNSNSSYPRPPTSSRTSPQSSINETAEMKLLKLITSQSSSTRKIQVSPSNNSRASIVSRVSNSSRRRTSSRSSREPRRQKSVPLSSPNNDDSQTSSLSKETIGGDGRQYRRRTRTKSRDSNRTRTRTKSRDSSRTRRRTKSRDSSRTRSRTKSRDSSRTRRSRTRSGSRTRLRGESKSIRRSRSSDDGELRMDTPSERPTSPLSSSMGSLVRSRNNASMSALEDAISMELEDLRHQSQNLAASQTIRPPNRKRSTRKSGNDDNASVRSMRSNASSAASSRTSPRMSNRKGEHRRRSSRDVPELVNSKSSNHRTEQTAMEKQKDGNNDGNRDTKREMKRQLSTPDLSSHSQNSRPGGSSRSQRSITGYPDENRQSEHTNPQQDMTNSRKGNFEEIWQDENDGQQSMISLDFDSSNSSSPAPVQRAVRRSSSKQDLESVDSTIPGIEKTKKTKLEKIHELQGKCDRYKQEWADASKEKRRYRKNLEKSQQELTAKKQELQTYVSETQILQNNLSDALAKLDTTQEEQRKERIDLSNAAKELAEARIGHAKAVNESRELRERLDEFQQQLEERDRQIESLKTELQTSKENIEQLEADILYADDQMEKLEGEIKQIEGEVAMYRELANKSNGEDGNDSNAVRDEMERRLHEDRETRLEEKQRKLDEKIKQFEEDKERHLNLQREREREFSERQVMEIQKSRSRDDARHQRDDEINEKLKSLEDDNTVLQGKLKSEQLEANVKLSAKDQAISELQKELETMKNEIERVRTDPSSVSSLQAEVKSSKQTAEAVLLDLEEALKHNAMLQESTDDAQQVNNEMKVWITALEDAVKEHKAEAELQKRKADEWQKKSGEWSDKAHQWKEKADLWEKSAKSVDPDANTDTSSMETAVVDPQALFLAAAVEKKKSSTFTTTPSNSRWGRLFNKGEEAAPQNGIEVLEIENTKQAVEIKKLKSELVTMQSQYKEKAYEKQRELEQLQKANDDMATTVANLVRELEGYKRMIRASSDQMNETKQKQTESNTTGSEKGFPVDRISSGDTDPVGLKKQKLRRLEAHAIRNMVVHHQTHGSDDGTSSTRKNVYSQNNSKEFSVFEKEIEAQRETVQGLQHELSMKEHETRRCSERQEDLIHECYLSN